MENSDVNKRESRPSTLLNSEDVRRERALSLKRSRAGHLGALTKAQNEVETLLRDEDSSNVTLVKEKFDYYETLWKNFVVSHNKFMDVAEAEVKAENAEHFDILAEQRISLSTSVEKFICNAATKLNEWVMEDLQKLTGPRHHGSARSRSHRSSRRSSSTYSSKAQARRLEAEKAQLALVFEEQERQRRIEEEMKMLELKRKQRELARMREAEEEELKAIIRLESLKTEADFKLAEARKAAAITDLEAKLTEEMEGGFSDNESSSVESTSFECAPPLSGNTVNPPLITVTHSAPPVTPNVLAMPAHLPGVSSTAMASDLSPPVLSSPTSFIQPNPSPSAVQGSWTSASTKVSVTPLNKPKTGVSSTTAVSSLSPPVVNNLTPSTLPYRFPPVKSSPFVPTFTKLPVTTVNTSQTGVSSVTVSGLSVPVANSLSPWATPFQPPLGTSSVNATPVPSAHGEVLTMVAAAMKDISTTQQKLAYNQSLPPIQFQKFGGVPAEFPLFKQRFERMVMSREDMDDSSKMTRLVQFLDGEAKQAVAGLETSKDGLHQALQILEQRYGRPCMIVNSVINSLVKGPPISAGDKINLRKFADSATRALATLTSMNCLSQVNQGNIVNMTERLPKPLQDKFATLACDLETKGQHFPTLTDFVGFVNKHANIANHPVSGKSQQFNCNNNSKNKRLPPNERMDIPKYTMNINDGGKPPPKPPPKGGKVKANSCRYCGQTHPLYRCETFKGKTPKERMSFVSSKKLCPNCLKGTEHSIDTCPSTFRCRVEGCGAFHHSLLHQTQPRQTPGNSASLDQAAGVDATTSTPVCATAGPEDSETVLLQVVPVRVVGCNGLTVTTYAMLDSGSEVTLVDPSLVSTLGLCGRPDCLVLSTVSNSNELQKGERVNLAVESLIDEQPQQLQLKGVWSGKELNIPLRHQRVAVNKERWPHLCDVPFPEVERQKISLIIGTNVPEVFVPLEVRHGSPNDPIAIRSCLGFAVLGKTGKRATQHRHNVHHIHTSANDVSLHQQVELFWESESLGTTRPYKSMSVEDRYAERIINSTISKSNDHYCMGLLWKRDPPDLPFNRTMAEIRLRHLKRRLEKDKDLYEKYRSAIDGYIAKGHARKLTKEQAKQRSNKTWYLPHHPVTSPNKPGKIRVVFDAAAKFQGTSLNDQLLQGPDYINNLAGVLMRFRQEEVVLIADIEQMFHQVRVPAEDCDALRFLWWSGNLSDEPEEYQMQVHIFGATSSPSCSNKALRQTADDNEDKYGSEVAETVRRNFYVDDLLKSIQTTDQATILALNLIAMLKEGGFHLTKFLSNRREVLSALPSQERANPTLNLELDRLPINRTLGLHWDAERDIFCFKTVSTTKPATKRGILSTISSLFDPLGFLSPFVLPVKVLIQDLWKEKVGWDEEIQDHHLKVWQRWTHSLPQLEELQLPRCYRNLSMSNNCTVQLHMFSDASEYAYSTSAYLRLSDNHGDQAHCSFVFGKCRNAPLRRPTIPRLELMASLMAVRTSNLIRAELDLSIDRIVFWTDSLTVLQYINNKTRRFHRFVATRLEEIHEYTTPDQWHHVPGILNPADDGSRGMPIETLHPGCRWWTGPEFLWQTEEHWPHREVGDVLENDKEVITPRASQSITATAGSSLDELLRKFSSWPKLLRTVAWIMRFLQFVRSKCSMPAISYHGRIRLTEMLTASRAIIKRVQRQYFQKELEALESGKPVKKDSKLSALSPILVDGAICVGGRLRHAPVAFQAIHPLVIPSEHPIATLLVRHHHEIFGHAGREHVLSTLRQKFWILNARQLTRRIHRSCIPCRKRHEGVMKQLMGDLPKPRLTPHEPPFTYTGVDFFGPFHVKRGRGTEKVYGCIFVCLTCRAIHIEDVGSLESDAFIQALRRFISIRGAVKEVWSDNGTNFTGGEREIRDAIQDLDHDIIERSLHEKDVEWHCQPLTKWHFHPPTASHMSGVWERLIRSVRGTMKAILGHPHAFVTRETLRTVFAETVGILNSRPLCPSSDDPNDWEPITPSHLLQQRQGISLPPGDFQDGDLYSRKQWRRGQILSNHFWARWLREYLPLLQERKKWVLKRRNLAVNDLVLVVTENAPRGHWLLGRVTKVFPGKDDLVRTAEVKTKNSTLLRPISKLCLLEESN